ncbi:PREDICTED: uncharacterized protein LOC109152048 [Ipomoea nil]|uniref:uncharacterized protein LOC109152048 n=1 Tax=Ipomoea nil TaxID=35883 RepID=UPI000900C799|nr:PREDICTED: uncharacterized protein LOC109152048 [Ipomoea nil]
MHSPFVLCLLEPFSSSDWLEFFRIRFNFDNVFASDNNKIWIFWNNDLAITFESQTEQCVTISCVHSTVLTPFWLSFVYAKTKERLRDPLWAELKAIFSMIPGGVPWSVAGDFNCLLSVDEKKGGLPYSHRKTTDFQECVSACDLIDAAYYGSRFTWWNGRRKDAAIWMRLDRFLYTSVWESVVPKHFVFLNVWIKHEDFLRVVRDSWRVPVEGAPMFVIATKLNRLGKVLSRWSKTMFGDIFVKLREYEDSVQTLEAIAIEEEFRQQKARITEVQDGDRNSRFFHSVVKARRRKLYIHRVKDGDGVWLEDRQGIANQAVSFFEHMFTAEIGGFDLARLDCVPCLVTEEDNELLTAMPEVEEVKAVVMQMNSTSAAGPDGFSGAFYKACWDIIQDDVVSMVRSYFAGWEFTRAITHTSIVLLPKKPSPETFADYRPISLCNFSSKLITKLMVVRMATVLPRVLSPQQSGFVAGRSITDNVLLAAEICHGLSLQNRDIVLKLDMAKAYDRVSWFFLTSVMRRLGFSEVWIDMVFRAVSNVWYSVIVNGVKEGFFTSTRGLRQGDPLSPTLFVITAEVLSVYLARVYDGTAVPRFTQPPGTPHIHHLAYADDVIIFSTARLGAIQEVIGALKEYEEISVQLVSFQKSAFYMHPRTPAYKIEQIRRATGCVHNQFPFTYLGCPVYIGRKKCIYFASVVDKVKARWITADLSRIGQGPRDIPLWTVASDGMFSYSSAKAFLRPALPTTPDPLLAKCWRKNLPFKVSFLAWRVFRGRLPTDDILARFGHVIVSRLIDIESTWAKLASYVDISVRPPWILDSVVSRLRFLCSCGVVTAVVCPSRANLPAQALADWVVDKPGEAVFRNLNDLPPKVLFLWPQRHELVLGCFGFAFAGIFWDRPGLNADASGWYYDGDTRGVYSLLFELRTIWWAVKQLGYACTFPEQLHRLLISHLDVYTLVCVLARSGRVIVKYCSAPTIRRYCVGFSKGSDEGLVGCVTAAGVAKALQSNMPECDKMSFIYRRWERTKLSPTGSVSMPKKETRSAEIPNLEYRGKPQE